MDRLSSLPDKILHHLLSFLPTKTSVSTSILSKRWHSLWLHVPALDFDSRDYLPHSRPSMGSFITGAFLLRGAQTTNMFHLHCNRDGFDVVSYDIDMWVSAVTRLGVRNLDLHLHHNLLLPHSLFTCKTLVQLTLKCCRVGAGVGRATCNLPCLKKLHLESVEYQVKEALLSPLAPACPVLEELTVVDCFFFLDDDYDISSPTIKRLALGFRFKRREFHISKTMVRINAPALTYLEVYDCLYERLLFSPPPSLVKARVHIRYRSAGVLKFLHSLCCNVECLELQFVDSDSSKLLMEPNQVSKCLLSSNLTSIEIHQFGCTKGELEQVWYLLSNAKCLKRMEIYCSKTEPQVKSDALNIISSFHRVSQVCQLLLH
ncbi:F-box/LRR-repeat protein [Striga hermonthica]|uniref:F-box/LRR-repeat protein n=1 Tax=Striga hermonthica TaxID=68872 RepID=A0A9N7NEJ7_STRHE|nr:F-box/LRR-repeat protein [Striga hermonthica]